MNTEEVIALQARDNAFSSTSIGMAFNRFKNNLVRAWVQDTEDSFNNRDRKSTKEAWIALDQAEKEFKALLIDLIEGRQ